MYYSEEMVSTLLVIIQLTVFTGFNLLICKQVTSDTGSRIVMYIIQATPVITGFIWISKGTAAGALPYVLTLNCILTCISSLAFYSTVYHEQLENRKCEVRIFMVIGMVTIMTALAVPLICFFQIIQESAR